MALVCSGEFCYSDLKANLPKITPEMLPSREGIEVISHNTRRDF